MKANELRIGNWVQKDLSIDDLITVKIKSGDLLMFDAECQDKESDFRTIFPIPLTEEILLKAGFELDKWVDDIKIEQIDDGFLLSMTRAWTTVAIVIADFQYVHQLQNLYFSLTGEELELELEY